ncbi:MAG: SAM hydroxide adenosyltransferase, partial [Spirochaetota bacterium]
TIEEIQHTNPNWSNTFHGRDLFAPLVSIAAVKGVEFITGEKVKPVVLKEVFPDFSSDASSACPEVEVGLRQKQCIIGKVIHIDRFGNCITSIHRADYQKFFGFSSMACTINIPTPGSKPLCHGRQPVIIPGLMSYYSEVAAGEALAYWGSSGFLEIAVREGNAAQMFGLELKDEVVVERETS